MQADSCQQESQDPEEARQPRDQAFLLSRGTDLISERMKTECEVAIGRRERTCDAAGKQGRRPGRRSHTQAEVVDRHRYRELRQRLIEGGEGIRAQRLLDGVTYDTNNGQRCGRLVIPGDRVVDDGTDGFTAPRRTGVRTPRWRRQPVGHRQCRAG